MGTNYENQHICTNNTTETATNKEFPTHKNHRNVHKLRKLAFLLQKYHRSGHKLRNQHLRCKITKKWTETTEIRISEQKITQDGSKSRNLTFLDQKIRIRSNKSSPPKFPHQFVRK